MSEQEIVDEIKKLMKEHPFSYFTLALSPKNPEIRKFILDNSSCLDGKISSKTHKPYNNATGIVYALNRLVDFPKCATCGNPIERDISIREDLSKLYCCNRCAQKDPDTIAKIKSTKLKNHGDPNWNNMEKNRKTCKERYGVEYSWQAKEVQDKCKKSIQEHFGVDHQMRSKEVIDGMCQRYREKHGVDYAFQDPKVQAKINAKMQQNYGVDWPMQSKELHDMMHKNSAITQKKNFYYNILCNLDDIEPLFDVDEWINHNRYDDKLYEFKWKCRKCGKVFASRMMWGASYYARCLDCNPYVYTLSNFEKEIADFINSIGNGFVGLNKTDENRRIIKPQEIDIVVKKNGKNVLFIEADGLYWHSTENGKDQFYHRLKTDRCNELGIQLIHIFEDEWNHRQDIVKSRIKNLLGIYDKTIYARKCEIKELNSKESKIFFDETHIQGNCNASIRFGLVYENELVAAMSFGRRRKITNSQSNTGEYELLRFSTKLGYHVVGGAGKLLKHFERTISNLKMLTSYADARWSIGKLYKVLGFKLDHISAPNYWYMPPRFEERLYRYGFRKSMQKKILPIFDENKTEMENMLANGYHIIYDCGNYVFKKIYV